MADPPRPLESDDDEVVVVGESGMDALKDYPHPRHACRNFAFGVSNTLFCAKCHCFVCDVPSAECREWGAGGGAGGHCDAHPGDAAWVHKRRSVAMAKAVAAGPRAPAPSASGPPASGADMKTGAGLFTVGGSAGYAGHAQGMLPLPAMPPKSLPVGVPPPDKPRLLGSALPASFVPILTGLKFKVKQVGTIPIDKIVLAEHGALATDGWHRHGGGSALLPQSFDALFQHERYRIDHPKPLFELERLDGVFGPVLGLESNRSAHLLLRFSDGSVPVEHGIKLSSEPTGAELLAKAREAYGVRPAAAHVVIWRAPSYGNYVHPTVGRDAWVVGARAHAKMRLMVGDTAESLERPVELPDVLEGNRASGERAAFVATLLPADACWVVVYLRVSSVEERKPRRAADKDRYGVGSSFPHDVKKSFGMLVVPVGKAGLSAALETSMSPFLVAGSEYEGPSAVWRLSNSAYGRDGSYVDGPFAYDRDREISLGDKQMEPAPRDAPVDFLAADWSAASAARFRLFSETHESAKAVHASIVSDAQAEWDRQRSSTRAWSSVYHVATAGRAEWKKHAVHAVLHPNYWAFYPVYPSVRYKATLEAASAEPGRGTLTLSVWANAASSSAHKSVFGRPSFANGGLGFLGHASGLDSALTTALECDPRSELLECTRRQMAAQAKAGVLRNDADSVARVLRMVEATTLARALAAAGQPAGLSCALKPYQLDALAFCLEVEAREDGPIFFKLPWNPRVSYCPWNKELALDRQLARGGFISEEMGLGKTVISLALIKAAPRTAPLPQGTNGGTKVHTGATLVVCPVSIVGQWADEVRSKTDLNVLIYHGSRRDKDPERVAAYDVVVTTYETVGGDFSRSGLAGSTLHRVVWHRIIADESHIIKNPESGACQAAAALVSSLRWCATGTPFGAAVTDLMGQAKFLHMSPFDCTGLYGPFIDLVSYLLSETMVRHAKSDTVAPLPPKADVVLRVELTASERTAYDTAHAAARAELCKLQARGDNEVKKHMLAIMSLLIPLRRIASGGALTSSELAVPDLDALAEARAAKKGASLLGFRAGAGAGGGQDDVDAALAKDVKPVLTMSNDAEAPCGLCEEVPEEACRTGCGHWFCRECLVSALPPKVTATKCPTCVRLINVAALRKPAPSAAAPKRKRAGAAASDSSDASDGDEMSDVDKPPVEIKAPPAPPGASLVTESKARRLLEELRAMGATDKAIVFSQFNSTIGWLKAWLVSNGFAFRSIEGSMERERRARAIASFQKDPPTTVFLISLRAGAVGINLTAANKVFLMEPLSSPALAAQAVGRAHRLGQTRPVTVYTLVTKDTVDERLVELAARRAAAGAEKDKRRNDAAGAIKEDKGRMAPEELDLMFH